MAPNGESPVRVIFDPLDHGQVSGVLSFSYIEDDKIETEAELDNELVKSVIRRTKTYSGSKDIGKLLEIKLVGIGGVFGMLVNDCDLEKENQGIESINNQLEENPSDNVPQQDDRHEPPTYKGGVQLSKRLISLDYAKVRTGKPSKKSFTISNTGDTVLEIMITDKNGQEIKDNYILGRNNRMSLTLSGISFSIDPHHSLVIEIIAEVIFLN